MSDFFWGIANPLFWLSVFWVVFLIEAFLEGKRMRSGTLKRTGGWITGVLFLFPSLLVAWKMVFHPLPDIAYMWWLQFCYMPIPPGGANSSAGLDSVYEYTFLIGYPFLNTALGFFGYNLVVSFWKNLWEPRAVAVHLVTIALFIAKAVFELQVLGVVLL